MNIRRQISVPATALRFSVKNVVQYGEKHNKCEQQNVVHAYKLQAHDFWLCMITRGDTFSGLQLVSALAEITQNICNQVMSAKARIYQFFVNTKPLTKAVRGHSIILCGSFLVLKK